MTQVIQHGGSDSDAPVIDQAGVVRRHLEILIDRVNASGALDLALLRELDRFLRDEALPAAEAYEHVLTASWRRDGGPERSACGKECWSADLTCPQVATFASEEEALRSNGHVPHRNEIDARAIALLHCICGTPLEYAGFRSEHAYRAYGLCRSCGHWLAF